MDTHLTLSLLLAAKVNQACEFVFCFIVTARAYRTRDRNVHSEEGAEGQIQIGDINPTVIIEVCTVRTVDFTGKEEELLQAVKVADSSLQIPIHISSKKEHR